MASTNGDKVLQAYIQRFGQIPDQPNQLVSFSRTDGDIPTIIYSEGKKSLSKLKTSIKTGRVKKKSFKKLVAPKWLVGDEVLISKDRQGLLKYIGKIPEMGDDNIYYGIELNVGTLGQHDGSIKGKRYFQTNGKRGMFIPERKLRRRLNRKDKERRDSYAEISSHVKQLQKEYAGDDAQFLYPSSQINDNDDDAANITTLVFENPDQAYKYGNGGNQYQSATLQHQQQQKQQQQHTKQQSMSPHDYNRDIPSKKKKKKKKPKKAQRVRTSSHSSSTSQSSSHRERYSRNNRTDSNDDDDDSDGDASSDVSQLDEDNEHDSNPTVKTFDTLLKYILRQKGQYREGLLDVYANPQTHALIVEAFSQMKQLQPAEQTFLWPALLKRWSRYTHKI